LILLDFSGLAVKQTVIHYSGEDKLMAAAIKYVKHRNGVYQYVRRVPEEVKQHAAHYEVLFKSQPLFRVSLKTKDEGVALRRGAEMHFAFERKLAAVNGDEISAPSCDVGTVAQQPRRIVTQSDLDALAARFRHLTVAPMERAYIRADSTPKHAEEYDRMLYELETNAEQIIRARESRGPSQGEYDSPADWAAWVVQNDNLEAPVGSEAYGAVVGAIRSGIRQGHDDLQAILEGRTVPQLRASRSSGQNAVPTLREAVDEYLKVKKLPPRTESEVKSSLNLFEKLYGSKRLDSLTQGDFHSYTEHLAEQTVGGKSAGSVVRPPSVATVKKRIGLLRAVINHAISRKKFAGPNPAGGINVDAYVARPDRAVMPAKRRLTVEEMNLIFQHPWFTGCASSTNTHAPGLHRLMGSEYWVPVTAALTGCRASELGGLMLTEVMLDTERPYLLIRDNKYRRTKGGYSRKVPLIDHLLDLGFADYVDSVRKTGAERVFPDWLPPKAAESGRNDDKAWSNGKIMRAFNRTVIPNMLGDRLIQGARQEVTFHSLRGAFKAMLGSAEYRLHPNIINEVIGHAKPELDARYVGEVPIEETYPAIRACRFKGLLIPKLL